MPNGNIVSAAHDHWTLAHLGNPCLSRAWAFWQLGELHLFLWCTHGAVAEQLRWLSPVFFAGPFHMGQNLLPGSIKGCCPDHHHGVSSFPSQHGDAQMAEW